VYRLIKFLIESPNDDHDVYQHSSLVFALIFLTLHCFEDDADGSDHDYLIFDHASIMDITTHDIRCISGIAT